MGRGPQFSSDLSPWEYKGQALHCLVSEHPKLAIMKIPVLPVAVLLSVLALHSAQGAALASSEVSNVTWLLLLADLLLSFFTLHPLLEKRLLPLAVPRGRRGSWVSEEGKTGGRRQSIPGKGQRGLCFWKGWSSVGWRLDILRGDRG